MPVERKRLLHWIWLSLAMGIANRETSAIIHAFGDASSVYEADAKMLSRFEGLSRRARRALLDKSLTHASHVFDLCERKEISILVYTDEEYPDALRTIAAPPVLLYYKGHLPDLNRRLCVAAVGTRTMSEYGMECAYKISYELSQSNAVIVSGMALGIDGVCSAAALAAGGDTVAILGCGVDVLYPKRHRVLCEEICRSGAVMSEYPPSTPPFGGHFPERNRIISGMSRATLAFEGSESSGALITAREALAEGRAVYALPGDVSKESSKGMNLLLSEGARPLISVQDIVHSFTFAYRSLKLPVVMRKEREECTVDVPYLERLGVLKSTRKEVRKEAASGTQTREAKAPQTPPEEETAVELDPSLLETLPPIQAEILRCIAQKGNDACIDDVYTLPYSFSEISTAMTQLEIRQLIRRRAGSLLGLNQAP